MPDMEKNRARLDEMVRQNMITSEEHKEAIAGIEVYLAGKPQWAKIFNLSDASLTNQEALERGCVYHPHTGKRLIADDAKFHPYTGEALGNWGEAAS